MSPAIVRTAHSGVRLAQVQRRILCGWQIQYKAAALHPELSIARVRLGDFQILTLAAHGLNSLNVHFAVKFAGVEALDHFHGGASITSQRQHVNFVALKEAMHDTGVPQAVDRALFAPWAGFKAQVVEQVVEQLLKASQRSVAVTVFWHEHVVVRGGLFGLSPISLQLFVDVHCAFHRYDWIAMLFAFRQRQAQIDVIVTDDFNMLVLHVLDVGGADEAVCNELDHARQLGRKLEAADDLALLLTGLRRSTNHVFVSDQLVGSGEQLGVFLKVEPAARFVALGNLWEFRDGLQQVAVLRMVEDFADQAQVALDRGARQVNADFIDELLQTLVVDLRDVQLTEFWQDLAIEEVLIVAMGFGGNFLARYASGLGFHEAFGARVKARVLGDGNAVVLVDQQLFVKRNRGLDGFALIGLAGATLDRAFAIEEPDLPERTGGHEVDLQFVGVALDGFERIGDWYGARWMRSRGLLCRRHSCSYWSSARPWRAGI